METKRPAHWHLMFDRVRHLDGRCGYVVSADVREAVVVFDPAGALPSEVETFPQFDTVIRRIGVEDPFDGEEFGSLDEAQEKLRSIEWELDDIQDEIDDLESRRMRLEEQADDLEDAIARIAQHERQIRQHVLSAQEALNV